MNGRWCLGDWEKCIGIALTYCVVLCCVGLDRSCVYPRFLYLLYRDNLNCRFYSTVPSVVEVFRVYSYSSKCEWGIVLLLCYLGRGKARR